jgi:chemotaxis protein CheY-P-specific phosphatase CheC
MESLSEREQRLILNALDAGAQKTAQYLSKLSQESWKCTASSIYHNFETPLFSTFPDSEKPYWSAYLPLQDGVPLGVHLIMPPDSVASLGRAWNKIYSPIDAHTTFPPQDVVREISNIVAHGFCGELGELFSTILILSVPEVLEGSRRRLVEEGFKKIAGANVLVVSNIVMSQSDFTIRCELYFYAESEMIKLFLRGN